MNSGVVQPQIEESWKKVLAEEFSAEYFASLKSFLLEEKEKYRIYPPGKEIFSAFNLTPFEEVKVVIIGQDPYHGPGQAHGLCFSVPRWIRKPPSLVNICKELHSDLGIPEARGGNLEPWAKQGVMLLNATLTVRAGQAGSHQGKGWEEFTDAVIGKLSAERSGLVFMLWGNFAIAKRALIDDHKHHVLTAAHPSPLSAHRGFFGCRHFSRTNAILREAGKPEIDWKIE